MNALIPFTFESTAIRVLSDDNGQPWFIAKDIAAVLGYSDSEAMTRRLDDDEKSNRQIVGLGPQAGGRGVTLINEAGLYSCILTSQKAEAKRFKRWVTHDVLPSIRRTGSYAATKPRTVNAALDKLRNANALKIAEETAAKLCGRFTSLSESAKQVIYAKIINPIAGDEILALPTVSERLVLAGEVGELLGVSGNKIGRLANEHGMKVAEFGEYRLDKSPHSAKQVEVFHYNASAIDRFRDLLAQGAGKPAHLNLVPQDSGKTPA